MKTRLFSLVFVAVLSLPVLYAQHPDFSGTWVLNKAKSNFQMGRGGGMPEITLKVTQSADSIKVNEQMSSEMGNRDRVYTLKLDGTDQQIQGFMNRPATASATWEGNKLLIATTMSFERQGQTMEMATDDTWSLSPDGKMLTIDGTTESSFGTRTSKRVFDKSN